MRVERRVARGDRRRRICALALLVATATSVGCSGSSQRPQKPKGSAVWLEAGSTLDEATSAELAAAGIGEVFLAAGRLGEEGTVEALALPGPPGGPVTLGVGGALETLDVAALLEGWRQLRFAAESRGAFVAGLHLDLRGDGGQTSEALERYAEQLEELRDALDRQVFLSVTLPAEWLPAPEVEAVAEAVDFVVPFLYGQRPGEQERKERWQLTTIAAELDRLDELDRPYLLGVVTLGTVTHGRDGARLGETTELSLGELFAAPRLDLVPGFTLEGGDRRTYLFEATTDVEIGPFALRRGDRLRATGLATTDVETLLRTLERRASEARLGQLYFRLPRPDERLSLGAVHLAAAHAAGPATPELAVDAELLGRVPGGYRIRVTLTNRSAEPTAYSTLDRNFVEVRVPRGEVDDRVVTGGFQRYDIGHRDDAGGFARSLRRPDTLRLFEPFLDGGQSVASGDVVIRQTGTPELALVARFLLPDGRVHDVGPLVWRGGELVESDEPPPR